MRSGFVSIAVATILVGTSARAGIEGTTFSSEPHNVRMTLTRGWRWADQPTYPGIILRMFHTRPRATVLVAVDPLDEVLEGISAECQTRKPHDNEAATIAPQPIQIVCEQRRRLDELGFKVASIKETERPWFDYTADRRYLRQGIAVIGESVFTVILAADTSAVRAQYARVFDKLLRSMRALEASSDGGGGAGDGGVPSDGGGATPVDAGQ